MCSSVCLMFYTLFIGLAAGLVMISVSTPLWRPVYAKNYGVGVETENVFEYLDIGGGDLWKICKSCFDSNLDENECNKVWESSPDWKRVSLVCLLGALIICILAFVASFVLTFLVCCFNCYCGKVMLPMGTGFACFLVTLGIFVYRVKSGPRLDGKLPVTGEDWQALEKYGDYGYTVWSGIAAIVVLFIDTLFGICLVKIIGSES